MSAPPSVTPLTVLIADDEEAPRAQLKAALLAASTGLEIVAECVNGADAWDAWLEHQPQICFLDIRMPGLSGIDVARRIAGRTPIAFVTAYGDHAIEAFDAGAVDYVVKPVDGERLGRTIDRLRDRALSGFAPQLQAVLDKLARQSRRPAPVKVLQSSQGREVRLIPVDEVIYFEADARYTRVVHGRGEALIRTPLKELLAELDDDLFWQIHRSVIVSRSAIAAAHRIDDTRMEVSLRGRPERLPVSRPFQGLFRGQ